MDLSERLLEVNHLTGVMARRILERKEVLLGGNHEIGPFNTICVDQINSLDDLSFFLLKNEFQLILALPEIPVRVLGTYSHREGNSMCKYQALPTDGEMVEGRKALKMKDVRPTHPAHNQFS